MSEDNGISEILTLGEAAAFIRVSEKTLGEMARLRRIPSQKVGREWRFVRTALTAWLAGGGANAAAGGTSPTTDRPPSAPRRVSEAAAQYELLPPEGFEIRRLPKTTIAPCIAGSRGLPASRDRSWRES